MAAGDPVKISQIVNISTAITGEEYVAIDSGLSTSRMKLKTLKTIFTKADIGLSNADNTSDADKPISTPTQLALDGKANATHTHGISGVTNLQIILDTKSDVSHTHAIADIVNLQTALDGKTSTGHTHLKSEVGLNNVDNTSDASKPISAATQLALDNKATLIHAHVIGDVIGLDLVLVNKSDVGHLHTKNEVGLSNVDNTSDLAKPVSTATQTALDGKSATGHTHVKADVGLANVDNTSDLLKPISSATQSALDGKSAIGHTHAIADIVNLTSALANRSLVGHIHTPSEVGLANVDNTSDANKPVSTATATALAGKAALVHTHVIGDVTGLQLALDGKSAIGHSHIVSDVTGLQAALDSKSALGHTHLKSEVGLANVDNTSDLAKPISTATQTALDGKSATGHVHDWSGITSKPTNTVVNIDDAVTKRHAHTNVTVLDLLTANANSELLYNSKLVSEPLHPFLFLGVS